MEVLEEHRILNTMQVCRVLNQREIDDFSWCDDKRPFGNNRFTKDNHGWCNSKGNGCNLHYQRVYGQLKNGERKHLWNSKGMRFYDSSHKALARDYFRFWFLDEKEFENRILCQTLIPYVKQGVSG